jgi:hypothetical protein
MNSMGGGSILRSKPVSPAECLSYAMTLPTSTVIRGMDSVDVLKQNLEAVRPFKPLTPEQVNALLGRTARAAAGGQYELFKTTANFDGTAHHPDWLG